MLLRYDDKEHKYFIDGKEVPSVTKFTGIVDKSMFLIPWALKCAERYLISNWPSYDSVGAFEREKLFHDMKSAHKDELADAGALGTKVHEWIEQHIRAVLSLSCEPEWPLDPRGASAVEDFLEWENSHHVQYLLSERKVYSLRMGISGTLDVLALVDRVKTLIDMKTSNGFRDDYRMQTAAYCDFYEEETQDKIEDRLVLMLSKDDGKPTPITLPRDTREEDLLAFENAVFLRKWKDKREKQNPIKRTKKRMG